MHSVFAESLIISLVSHPLTQIIHYYVAKKTQSQYIGGECTLSCYFAEVNAALLLPWALRNNRTLLKYTLSENLPELLPIKTHSCGKPNRITLLSSSQFWCSEELYRLLTPFWGIPNFNTLLRYAKPQYIAEVNPILTHWWGKSNLITLLSNCQF